MASSAPATTAPASEFRLPTDVKPVHYDVTIRTDLEKLTFDGFVKVEYVYLAPPSCAQVSCCHSLDVKKETSSIVFNNSSLTLGAVSVHSDSLKEELAISSRDYNATSERTTLNFSKPLAAGSKVQLQAAFDGPLTGSMAGYYRSSYEVDGAKKYYALTQFEVCRRLTSRVIVFLLITVSPPADLRAPSIPLLGRADAEGNVHGHSDFSRENGQLEQHACRLGRRLRGQALRRGWLHLDSFQVAEQSDSGRGQVEDYSL